MIHWLLTNQYWIAAQGIIQNSTVIFWAIALISIYHVSCDAHIWCWRPGRIKVEGTSWLTCSNHSHPSTHHRLKLAHHEKHPRREKQ